jgi:hypothetical protein
MYKNKFFFLVLSSLILAQFANSQNNTNSPYTRFGYGEISDNNSGEQRAMGGVSIGSRSNYSINTVNPASYSSVDTMTFMFDMGTTVLGTRFSDSYRTQTNFNANLEYLTMQFPLAKNLGFSLGLLPYSFLGYNLYSVNKTHNAENDTIAYSKNFSGEGGFSQVYTGLSYNLFNHISLGVNVYYMYGHIYNTRSLRIGSSSDSTIQYNTINANNFRLRYGIQFYNTFNKIHELTLGLIYEHKAKLNGSFMQTTYGVITEKTDSAEGFELPTMYGVGINYIYDKKISIGLDYSMQEWGDALFFGNKGNSSSLKNCSKLALGVEYIPKPRGRKYTDRIRYRGGLNMSDTYYKLDGGTTPKNYGLSCGIGLPLHNNKSVINATIEYGKIGSTSSLREDYLKFTFNAVFNENWFFKRKL